MSDAEIRAGFRAARAVGVNPASLCTPKEVCAHLASLLGLGNGEEDLARYFLTGDPGHPLARRRAALADIADAATAAEVALAARRNNPLELNDRPWRSPFLGDYVRAVGAWHTLDAPVIVQCAHPVGAGTLIVHDGEVLGIAVGDARTGERFPVASVGARAVAGLNGSEAGHG